MQVIGEKRNEQPGQTLGKRTSNKGARKKKKKKKLTFSRGGTVEGKLRAEKSERKKATEGELN